MLHKRRLNILLAAFTSSRHFAVRQSQDLINVQAVSGGKIQRIIGAEQYLLMATRGMKMACQEYKEAVMRSFRLKIHSLL